ncbi:MAG: dihydroorotase [Proteobacteria bacterium]|nr:dihydroorotase [Pseudomonadota bacterium]
MNIHIKNGLLIDPVASTAHEIDVFIEGNLVVGTATAPEKFKADQTIDATGHWVMPGLVDCQARLREPGLTHKGNIESETRAAVANGITSVCMPPDTQPVIDNSAVVELIHHSNAKAGNRCHIYTIGALSRGLEGEHLTDMASLKESACIAFSNANRPFANNLVQRRAMEYAAGQDMLVIIQPRDADLYGNGCAHESAISTRLGLPAIPVAAETAALAKDIELVAQTGARTHFGQLSCARSVEMIRQAKASGLPVTSDCAMHQLFLTDHDIGEFDTNKLTMPPLRSQHDRQALREGVADGTLDCLCSDHQPHEIDAKLRPFPSAEAGISTFDTLLPLALRLVEEKLLPLPQLIAKLSINPARILGIPAGQIASGELADITIVDPAVHWICSASEFTSEGKNTAFEGWDFNGRVVTTIVAGQIVYKI